VTTTFNDELFELDKNLLDLGLQVFPRVERNNVFDKLASPLPPLPSVAANSPYDFIEQLSIKQLSFQLSNFEPLSIKTMPIGKCPLIQSF
jgi:hypothetical protein